MMLSVKGTYSCAFRQLSNLVAFGVLMLLTGGGCGIWALIDLVRIITGDLQPKDGTYTETL